MLSQPGGPRASAGTKQPSAQGEPIRRRKHGGHQPQRGAAPVRAWRPVLAARVSQPPGLEPNEECRSEIAGLRAGGGPAVCGNVRAPAAGLCSAADMAGPASVDAAVSGLAASADDDGVERQDIPEGQVPSSNLQADDSTTASGASSPRSSVHDGSMLRRGSHSSSQLDSQERGPLHPEQRCNRATSEDGIMLRRGSHSSSRLDSEDYRCCPGICPPVAAPAGLPLWWPPPAAPVREVLRIRHSWQREAWCSTAQLSVHTGEFVRAWVGSRTLQGWIYAERLVDECMAGWLPAAAAEQMPPGLRWMRAVQSWAATQAFQMHVEGGSVLLVSSEQRTADGLVFAELPGPEAGASPAWAPWVLRGPQAGWVPMACLEWPAC